MDFISPPKAEAHSFTLQSAHTQTQRTQTSKGSGTRFKYPDEKGPKFRFAGRQKSINVQQQKRRQYHTQQAQNCGGYYSTTFFGTWCSCGIQTYKLQVMRKAASTYTDGGMLWWVPPTSVTVVLRVEKSKRRHTHHAVEIAQLRSTCILGKDTLRTRAKRSFGLMLPPWNPPPARPPPPENPKT